MSFINLENKVSKTFLVSFTLILLNYIPDGVVGQRRCDPTAGQYTCCVDGTTGRACRSPAACCNAATPTCVPNCCCGGACPDTTKACCPDGTFGNACTAPRECCTTNRPNCVVGGNCVATVVCSGLDTECCSNGLSDDACVNPVDCCDDQTPVCLNGTCVAAAPLCSNPSTKCCSDGQSGDACANPVSCCTDPTPVCLNGACVAAPSPNNKCAAGETQCCSFLALFPELNLPCKCCGRGTTCVIPLTTPLFGFLCI